MSLITFLFFISISVYSSTNRLILFVALVKAKFVKKYQLANLLCLDILVKKFSSRSLYLKVVSLQQPCSTVVLITKIYLSQLYLFCPTDKSSHQMFQNWNFIKIRYKKLLSRSLYVKSVSLQIYWNTVALITKEYLSQFKSH